MLTLLLFLYLWQTIFVSQWVHTKLTVAIILSLLFLLPAFAHAEGIMCEVGLCREKDKQRIGWRDGKKKKWLSAMPRTEPDSHSSVIRKGQGCHYKTQASHSSAWGRRRWYVWWDHIHVTIPILITISEPSHLLWISFITISRFQKTAHKGRHWLPDLREVVVISGKGCSLTTSGRVKTITVIITLCVNSMNSMF